MINKFFDWLSGYFIKSWGKRRRFSSPRVIVFAAFILPLLIFGFISSVFTFQTHTKHAIEHHITNAHFAATVVKERLDRMIEVGVSLATRVKFRQLIEGGNWKEAIEILREANKDFPWIERIFLADPQGTERAAYPELAGAVGQNFAFRDWYKGVSKNWKPYVSEVYRRAAEPQLNLVAIAVPIKSGEKVLGILVLQVRVETFADWAKEINIGHGGYIYLVDQKGHIIGHPKFPNQGEIVDFSELPHVQKLLRGEKGIIRTYVPQEEEEDLLAFEPIPTYGWGAVVNQPTEMVFADRSRQLLLISVIFGFLLLLNGSFAFGILRLTTIIADYQQKQERFLDGIGDGVFAIDRHWRITLWNKAASQLAGWNEDEVLGKPFREVVKFIRKKDGKENITFIEDAMVYGEPRAMENDTVLITKSGEEILVGDSASPIRDISGNVVGAIIVFRDISKEMEIQKFKDEFLFRTIHDLRAPANIIRLVLEKYSDPKVLGKYPGIEEDVGLVREANTRMHTLVENLLKIAKGEKVEAVFKKINIYLPNLVQRLLRELGPAIKGKELAVNYSPPEKLSLITGEEESVKEVFANLVDNAIKYNKKGGSITITHAVEEKFLKTVIQDTGIGIAPEEISEIFKPYTRGAVGSEIIGTGLGLYIVKTIVEKMGGKIEVTSELGKGSTFTVSLPILVT